MLLRPQSEFIFIGRGDESFLENYSYELSDDPGSVGGRIFMALEILNNQAEGEDVGEAIFANFRQKFYESIGSDPYDRFEEALKAANKTIEAMREEKVSRFIGNLNISIGAVVGDTLYISATGDAEVYLVRRRFVSSVSEGLAQSESQDVFANVGSGTMEEGDCVLFASSRLLRYITKGDLGKLFGLVGPRQIGKALSELSEFLSGEILGRCAVVGAYMGIQEEESDGCAGVFESPEAIRGFLGVARALAAKLPRLDGLRTFFSRLRPSRLGDFFGGLKDSVLQHLPQKLAPKKTFRSGLNKKRLLLIIILLAAILLSGTLWLRSRVNQNRIIAENQARLNTVRQLMGEASTIGQYDKAKAADILDKARQEAQEVLNGKVLRGEAAKVMGDLTALYDTLDEVKRIAQPNLLADFSQKRSTVNALGLANLADRIFGFEYNALYEIVLDKLSDPQTISDIETVILGASFPENESLMFLTRSSKMIEYAGGRFVDAPTSDGIWKKGVDMKSYNERVYILDPDRNQIWRYTRRRDGFAPAEGIVQNVDLKNAISLAIDSSIYVLSKDGTITQLYQGQKQEFPLRRSPLNALTEPTRIFTAPELNHLFVLEPTRKRVLLYRKDTKNGGAQYQSQYVFDNIGVPRDLVVYDNRLFVMDDKKVYFVNLSGL